ncbi:MAG: AAA family ATPase [Oscillospiraceae bacterium]|nr:AAA family ATPase [Oscillospiraceae bacterium]
MEINDLLAKLETLEVLIEALPRGSITTKRVKGHIYHYLRWYEGKTRREKYIPEKELDKLRNQIEERKSLQLQRKELLKKLPKETAAAEREDKTEYNTMVRRGAELRSFMEPALKYHRRECYSVLRDYIFGPQQDKVFVLYGLRRTGKTTMIRQIFADMNGEMLKKTAFIQITAKNTLSDVNRDLRALERNGYRYVFLDEVTLMEDFIDGAAVLSDVFAASGMKIVLSGTDSLGFLFTEDQQLYDRCIMLHTTFIPYREFEQVLGIKGIDEYIRYGGTMSVGGLNYNEDSPFASSANAREYVDTAIAHNIQHSLRCYQQSGHFRKLQELYKKDELTSAINRVVEDQTHRFTVEVLTRDFSSNDLALSARNLRRDRKQPNDILDKVDTKSVTKRLMDLLEIRNREDQTVVPEPAHAEEIREYLTLLDLTQNVDIVTMPGGEKMTRTVIAQSGLRYAQATALIESLLLDKEFIDLSITERNSIQKRIISKIMGRMMEDAVLLETKLADPRKQVFIMQFAVGEFDMVVFDPASSSCRIYEIKHSTEIAPEQSHHLTDEEKCRMTEHRFGTITGRYVIYRGPDTEAEDVQYLNVERYLCSLGPAGK